MKAVAILLSGGKGLRMGFDTPKQYLYLQGLPIALYSFATLCSHKEIDEIIVVCEEVFKPLFINFSKEKQFQIPLRFATPGNRRQDSLYSGLNALVKTPEIVLVHDAARPFIDGEDIDKVCGSARLYRAATLSLPVKATIREVDENLFSVYTPDRTYVREILTPQALHYSLLTQGFAIANEKNLTVTDDVSLAELSKASVKLVEGKECNIKITTKKDLLLAEEIAKTFFKETHQNNVIKI